MNTPLANKPSAARSISLEELPFYCLLAAGTLELLYILLGGTLNYVAFYFVENYLIIPCVLFAGAAMIQPLPENSKKIVLLSLVMVGWFLVSQTQHRLVGMEPKKIGMFFCVYLLALPYASLAKDNAAQKGLRAIAGMYVAAAIVLSVYTANLYFDCLPSWLAEGVTWDGTRLQVLWHPNIAACLFMIGIAFSFGFWFQAKRPLTRVLLTLGILSQFCSLALTNCRTSILVTCALIGGIFFFALFQGGWKRFLLLALAAILVISGLFLLASHIYQANQERIEESYALSTAASESSEPGAEEAASELSAPADLSGNNPQGTFLSDLATLNGRTEIWRSAFQALRDNPSLLLWGTEYSGSSISYYNSFPAEHAHNSWIEVLFRMGLPGLAVALVLTWMAVRACLTLLFRSACGMWKKCIALLVPCLLMAGFLEPFLFNGDISYFFLDFIFLLCLGYLDIWYHQAKT